MSISIQTNVNAIVAQENLRTNTEFQSKTIERLTSGYRINSSSDDAAGLAVANKFRSDTAELTQGVRNANDGISTLQIIDGGANNISKILDRMKTLATQAASSGFNGNRTTLDNEFQSLKGEIDRQAANVGLNAGGASNTQMNIYIGGGGSNQANSKVSVDLSGLGNAINASQLGVGSTSLLAGGTQATATGIALNTAGLMSLNGASSTQQFTFQLGTNAVTATVSGTTGGITTDNAISQLNAALNSSNLGICRFVDRKPAGLDPLHGRSRALPPHQLHLLRQDAGHRHRRRGGRATAGLDDLRRQGPHAGQGGRRAAGSPGVDQVAPFGATLHVVGSDRQKLEAALADVEKEHEGITVAPGETSLEDVFIQFMAGSKDNMAMNSVFSFARLGALLIKEFIQMRRDRITFAMMLGVPLHAAGAVRLRHQQRSEGPADGAGRARATTSIRAPWSRRCR